jgi:hypothetical protein
MSQPKITLDQWSALVAVVEAGGYAQASARLHRTQSTVTYTITDSAESAEEFRQASSGNATDYPAGYTYMSSGDLELGRELVAGA